MFTAGDIRIYIEHKVGPVIEFKDSVPLKIAYFGFSSLGNSLARFFYNCTEDNVYARTQLIDKCESLSNENSTMKTFRIADPNDVAKNSNLLLDFQFFVEAVNDYSVRFTMNEHDKNGYQIGETIQLELFLHFLIIFL